MAKSKHRKREERTCSCCTVRFRGDLCPQCYVAGCAHKAKGKPCLLNSGARATQEMTEHQLREAYVLLLAENQRLQQLLSKVNGHAELSSPVGNAGPPVKMVTRLVEGELHG